MPMQGGNNFAPQPMMSRRPMPMQGGDWQTAMQEFMRGSSERRFRSPFE